MGASPGRPSEANEAVADIEAVWFDPDPHSHSKQSVRIIGYSYSRRAVLTIILVRREGGAGYWVGRERLGRQQFRPAPV